MNSIRTALLFFLASTTTLLAAEKATRPPNVLFLISDDLNTRVGCYGDPQVLTPNLDRLAARGVRFEHAYCQYPLCGPSRNSMLCGLYPNSTGIVANAQIFRDTIPERVSLPQAFRRSNYFAARIGKLYHYHVPKSVGTNGHDDPVSWEMEINPAGCDRLVEEPDIFSLVKKSFGGTLSWYASPRPDEQHTDGIMAEDAAWVLQRCAQRRDRPFFLAVGFYRPHTPYVAPAKYFEHYALDEMPVAQDVAEDVRDVPKASLLSSRRVQDEMSDDLRRQAIQAYYASTTFMDAQVGKVLDALDANGLTDNTIVVFTSDHGYHLSEKGLWQKQSLFEQSARVPLIMAGPGIADHAGGHADSGAVCKSPVGLIDLYPTLTDLCGVETTGPLQGQSLKPMLADVDERGRGYALTHVQRSTGKGKPPYQGYSLRTATHRFTLWKDGELGTELYDQVVDPFEKRNLAHGDRIKEPGVRDLVDELTAQLQEAVANTFPPSGERPEHRYRDYIMELPARW
ncbi:MAG: sulfatase [Planctomycetota bacterium]